MKSQKSFSFKARLESFKYAFSGILEMIKTQHNAWIHLLIAGIVVAAGFLLDISKAEWIAVVLASGMVLMAEAFNTAIELLVDKISPHQDAVAGKIKDIAAGAVLFAATAAAIVGLLIFVPKLMELLP
jgi:diacylglycerol kinase (ATP)